MAGGVYDPKSEEVFYFFEVGTNVANNYRLDLSARFISKADPGEIFYVIRHDDYIRLRFTFSF